MENIERNVEAREINGVKNDKGGAPHARWRLRIPHADEETHEAVTDALEKARFDFSTLYDAYTHRIFVYCDSESVKPLLDWTAEEAAQEAFADTPVFLEQKYEIDGCVSYRVLDIIN